MEHICLNIDGNLLASGFRITGLKTAEELINLALSELLRREAQKKILDLKGKIEWTGNLTEMRSGRDFYDLG